MKSVEILLNSSPDLACRNLWLKSGKVSLFIADSVSFPWSTLDILILCQPQRK